MLVKQRVLWYPGGMQFSGVQIEYMKQQRNPNTVRIFPLYNINITNSIGRHIYNRYTSTLH